nr:serine hydrolase [Rhodococcus sp. DMU1]
MRTQLPWFTAGNVTASAAITVRQLLQHTSGLSDRRYNRALGADISLEEWVRDLCRARPTAAVGTSTRTMQSWRCSSKLSARRHQRRLELPSRTPPRCSPCLPQGRPHHPL